MKSSLIYAAAIAAIGLLSTGADAAPPIPPAVEKSVIDIVESVAGGKDLALPSGLRPLSAHEIAVVKGFAGCAPNRNPDSTVHEVITDWTCPSDNEPRAALATRSITLRFDYRGQMFSFELNPSTLDFNPTSVALANRKLPSPAKQTALFRDAIEEGGDITLAGLVPLTDLQVAELSNFKGARIHVSAPLTKSDLANVERMTGKPYKQGDLESRRYHLGLIRPA